MFKHGVAPLCQIFRNCRFQKCQFSHTQKNDNESYSAIVHTVPVDDESDSDSFTLDNESDETTTEEIQTNPARCDYRLCEFQQILFKTKSDLKTHLRNHHGIVMEQ